MSPQEFLQMMTEISKIKDENERRAQAEELLCTALTENGFIEGMEVYNQMKKDD